jgi:CTP-dependent riboflavin kinase|tara:strand:- start:441 stop:749 length:309 start_codon:yes stop_codon:yes gene_type:complete
MNNLKRDDRSVTEQHIHAIILHSMDKHSISTITNKELADYAGISRDSASRAVSSLARKGYLSVDIVHMGSYIDNSEKGQGQPYFHGEYRDKGNLRVLTGLSR